MILLRDHATGKAISQNVSLQALLVWLAGLKGLGNAAWMLVGILSCDAENKISGIITARLHPWLTPLRAKTLMRELSGRRIHYLQKFLRNLEKFQMAGRQGHHLKGKVPAHAWKKGQSGNPGGKPKNYGDIVEAAQALCPRAIQRLGEIMDDPRAPAAARVTAANSILERGFGKPIQPMLTDERRDKLVERIEQVIVDVAHTADQIDDADYEIIEVAPEGERRAA